MDYTPNWIIAWCLLILTCPIQAQIQITVTGDWNFSIPSSDITEAGSDLTGVYSSNSDEVLIDVFQAILADNNKDHYWRVDISKTDVDWDNNLVLYARRTTDGVPMVSIAKIAGGTSYQEITNLDTYFFRGVRSILDINVQYQIKGATLTLPAKTYSTVISYTVTQL